METAACLTLERFQNHLIIGMFCGSLLMSMCFQLFCAFLFLTPGVYPIDKARKACVLLQSHIDSYEFAANSTENSLLGLTYRNLDVFINKLKALPRLHCMLTLSTLSQHLNSENSAEMFYYFAIFFNELTETLLHGACVDLEKKALLLRRNLTRPAFVVASLKSFKKEQVALVHKCLYTDEYYTGALLAEDDQSVLPMSTCLNYQLLLRRTENLSKTIAWHIRRRDPEHCYAGLLQLLMRCFGTMDENAKSQACIQSVDKCHNLVDVCLGPIDSSSSGVLFHIEKLLKITQQLQEIYDPILQLRIVNASINAITIEKIQSVVEDCEILGSDVDESTGLLEQTNQNVHSYVSAVKRRPIDASFKGSELEDVVNSLRSNLDKARNYMERIEEEAKLVESQVCMPYKKQIWNASDVKESVGDHLRYGDRTWDDDPSCRCKVEALRDISSAYQAAQYPSRKYFNVLLHGSGYEPDLPEGPLLVVELKSVPRIHRTPAPATALDQQTYVPQSNEMDQTVVSTQWLEWSMESTSGLERLSTFILFSWGLTFSM